MKTPIPREIWVLVAAALAISLGYGIIAPVLPQFAKSFDVGFAAASGIVTAFAVMRLVFAPAGGGLVQRFGERWIYITGLSIVALSTGAVAFAQSYPQLIVFRGLGGIGSVMFTLGSMGLLVRLAPPAIRGRTSSLYGTAFLLGNIGGPILGTVLLPLGYRTIFLIYASALLVATATVLIFLREPTATASDPHALPTMTLAQAWAHPTYRAVVASSFANGWTNFGTRIALLPLMAAALPSLGPAYAGIALTLFALGNAAVQQFTGRLVDSRGRRGMVIIGLALSAVATLVFGWATEPPVFLGLTALAGMGAAFMAPGQQAAVADVIGNDRRGGQAIAALSMAADLGSVGGTLLTGAVADAFGFGWAFVLSGAVLALAIVPWWGAPETRPAASSPR